MEMRVFIGGYFTYADRVDDVDVGVDGTGGRLQRQQVVEHVRHLRHLAEVDEVIVQLVRKCRVREDKVAQMHTSETCKDMYVLAARSTELFNLFTASHTATCMLSSNLFLATSDKFSRLKGRA